MSLKSERERKADQGFSTAVVDVTPMMPLSLGSAFLLGAFILVSLLKLGFSLGMARLLDPAQYGMLGVGEALMMVLFLVIGSAFPWAVMRLMAVGRRDVVKSSLVGNLIVAVLACSLLYALFKLDVLRLSGGYLAVLVAVWASVVVGAAANVYTGALQGLFRFKQAAIIRCIDIVILLVLGFPLVALGYGAAGAMAGYVVGGVVSLFLAMYWVRDIGLRRGELVNRELYSLAFPLFLGVVGTQLLMNIDILGIKSFSPVASDVMAGHYKAVLVLARIPVLVVTALMGAFFPFISRYSGVREKVRVYSSRMLKYVFVFILPISLALVVVPARTITVLFPDAYAAGGDALRVLSVGMFLLTLITIMGTLFQAVGRSKLVAAVLTPAVLLQIGLLYLLVPRYGLTGAASATTVSCCLGLSVLLFKYARAYVPEFKLSGVAKVAVACLLQGTLLYFFPMGNRALVVIALVLSYGLYLLVIGVLRFLEPADIRFILCGMLPKDSRFLRGATRFVSTLNGAGARR
jgi:O-antigen/teichoic acid export membrane protein